jgi:hypothetical protein
MTVWVNFVCSFWRHARHYANQKKAVVIGFSRQEISTIIPF